MLSMLRPTRTDVLAFLLAALAAAPPAASQDAPPDSLVVTEVWTSAGLDWVEELSSPDGLAEGPDGTLWVSDIRLSSALVVAPPFTGTPRTLRKGDGPGEFDGPERIDITPDGHIAVYDIGRNSVELFEPQGDFVRRIQLPLSVSWTKGFAALASGGYVISGGVIDFSGDAPSVEHAIYEFAPDGQLVRSFGEPAEAQWRAAYVGTGGALNGLDDGSFLYSQGAPHRVVRYVPGGGADEDYWREEVIAEFPDMFDAPGDGTLVEGEDEDGPYTSFNVTYPQSRAVFDFGDDAVLNVVVMRDEDRSVWQLLAAAPARDGQESASREPIAEAHVEVAYQPWFQCANGDILAHRLDPATDIPVIVRLRVERVG